MLPDNALMRQNPCSRTCIVNMNMGLVHHRYEHHDLASARATTGTLLSTDRGTDK